MRFSVIVLFSAICAPIIVHSQSGNENGKKYIPLHKKFQPPKAELHLETDNVKEKKPKVSSQRVVEIDEPDTVADQATSTSTLANSELPSDYLTDFTSFIPFGSLYPEANDGTLDENGFEDQDKVVDVFPGALPSDFDFKYEQNPYFPHTKTVFDDEEQSDEEQLSEEDTDRESNDDSNKKPTIVNSYRSSRKSSKKSTSDSTTTKIQKFWDEEFSKHFLALLMHASSEPSQEKEDPIEVATKTEKSEDSKHVTSPMKPNLKFVVIPTSSYDSTKDLSSEKSISEYTSQDDVDDESSENDNLKDFSSHDTETWDFGDASSEDASEYRSEFISDYSSNADDSANSEPSEPTTEHPITFPLIPYESGFKLPSNVGDDFYYVTHPMTATTENPLDENGATDVDFEEIDYVPIDKDELEISKTTSEPTPKADDGDKEAKMLPATTSTKHEDSQSDAKHAKNIEDNEIPHKDKPNAKRISLAAFLKTLFDFIPVV